MTKTKRQLRAEAVERLKMLDVHGGGSFEYAILGSDKMAWRYMDKRDALIDLLTDDEPDDGLRYRIIRDGVYMSNVKGCELRDTDIVDGVERSDDGVDSREKLEADVRKHYSHTTSTLMYPPSANKQTDWLTSMPMDTVFGWLDRQEAITAREFCWADDALQEELDRVRAERDELKKRVDELVKQRNRAESDAKTQRNNYEQVSSVREHWQKKAREAEAERDGYREKLGRALGLAGEIAGLMP